MLSNNLVSLLKPAAVIERSQLPLSFLDPIGDSSSLPLPRVFSAHIDVLESQHAPNKSASTTPKVLIAEVESDKSLYAVERVSAGIYALCRLGKWVKIRDLRSLKRPAESYAQWHDYRAVEGCDRGEWWQRAAVTSHISKHIDRPASKRLRVPMAPPSTVCPKPVQLSAVEQTPPIIATTEERNAMKEPTADPAEPQIPPQQVFENVLTQYLETLYLSKTSLAYFTKGPLSRARAASSRDGGQSLPLCNLTEFLQSMLLTVASADRKYREELPRIIKELPPSILSDDDQAVISHPISSKKRKNKRLKPNKNGMYPFEEDYIKNWWHSHVSNSAGAPPDETAEQVLMKRLAELRWRETTAQIILVLEILALESSSIYKASQAAKDDTTTNCANRLDKNVSEQKPKKRSKKLQDPSLLMDMLVDRLCIWQSVEQDIDTKELASEGSTRMEGPSSHNVRSKTSSDRLKSFCVEVIIPFYVSRLPELAPALNKKLGGPSALSLDKRKRGELDSRNGPIKKPRRPLERVATESTKQTTQRLPSLTRSATDSLITLGVKRESSEVALAAIPLQEKQPKQPVRSAALKRFSQREVDLTAISVGNETKKRKKLVIDEELKNAISTLKKPNRGLAVKEYVESTEQRNQAAALKPPTAARKILHAVQVTATPKRDRKAKPDMLPTPKDPHDDPTAPPFNDRCIPLLSVHPARTDYVPSTTHKRHERKQAAIEDTPSRGSAKTVSFLEAAVRNRPLMVTPSVELPGFDFQVSTDNAHLTNVHQTPSKPPCDRPAPAVFATPVKSSCLRVPAMTPTLSQCFRDGNQLGERGGSIYDALGWNNDADELA